MEDVKTIKAEREVLEKQLKEPVSDISNLYLCVLFMIFLSLSLSVHSAPKFLQALKEMGDVDEEAISEAHIRGEYGKYQEQVQLQILPNKLTLYCLNQGY